MPGAAKYIVLLEHVTGRVVTVSSTGHRLGSIDSAASTSMTSTGSASPTGPDVPTGSPSSPTPLFTAELQRRLSAAGSAVLATAAHPGYAATNLRFHSQRRAFDLLGAIGNRRLVQDEDGGALPTLYAAVADVPGNSFAGPSGFMEQRGAPKLVGRSQGRQGHGRGTPPLGGLRGVDPASVSSPVSQRQRSSRFELRRSRVASAPSATERVRSAAAIFLRGWGGSGSTKND